MDMTATMLAAAGRNVEALELDGSSLLPVLRNENEVSAQPLFWRTDSPMNTMRAVRHENWKYVVDSGTQLLFDLEADIGERTDLFAVRPGVARELRAALSAWEKSLTAQQ
jgi:arylsulfatase A-like enzyme